MVRLMLCSLLVGAPAWADDQAAARKLFEQGVALHEKREFAPALEKFRAAYERWNNPAILPNIGTAAWELGRYVEAAEAYETYLRVAPADAADRAEVKKALDETLAQLATLSIEVRGGAADVTIDAQPVDPKKLAQVRVAPGKHTIVAASAGGARVEEAVDVGSGSVTRVVLSVGSSAGQPSQAGGTAAPAPAAARDSASPAPQDQQASGGSALPWIAGGIGAAGLVTGGVLFALRASATSELEDECIDGSCPDSSQPTIDRAERYGVFGTIALGVGVVGVGTAIVLWVSDDQPRTGKRSLELRAAIDPSAATLYAGGRF